MIAVSQVTRVDAEFFSLDLEVACTKKVLRTKDGDGNRVEGG